MMTMDNASRVLHRALQLLIAVVVLIAASLIIVSPTITFAESTSQVSEVIRLVNVEREKAGLQPLVADVQLLTAATVRAKEAASLFSHSRPNGTKWKTVFDDLGLTFYSQGENLAYGQRSAKAVVRAWMASPAHRNNILDSTFERIAVAQYRAKGTPYWSLLFARSTPLPRVIDGDSLAYKGNALSVGHTAVVIDRNIALRTVGAAVGRAVFEAPESSIVTVLELEPGWARVETESGMRGWASTKYLAHWNLALAHRDAPASTQVALLASASLDHSMLVRGRPYTAEQEPAVPSAMPLPALAKARPANAGEPKQTPLAEKKEQSTRIAQVIDRDLNLRDAGSACAEVVRVIKQGATLTILEAYSGWAHVRLSDGTEGWASMKYLAE